MKKWNLIVIFLFSFQILVSQEREIDTDGNYVGIVRVKFTRHMEEKIDQFLISKVKKGSSIVQTGIEKLDLIHDQHGVHQMKRIFRHAGKHEQKHRDFGLHLWYQLEYKSSISAKDLAEHFNALDEVEVANAMPKVIRKSSSVDEKAVKEVKRSKSLFSAPNDPRFPSQWHLNNTGGDRRVAGADISMLEAWRIQTGNSNVIVAVTDRGIDHTHEDLVGNMWVNTGEIPGNGIDDDDNGYVDDIHGYDFEADTAHITPRYHGTHVAGIIAAETNNGIGVAGIAGGTGNDDGVRLMSCSMSFDHPDLSSLAEAYTYAADNGAVISQNSWSYSTPRSFDQAILDGIDYFILHAGGSDAAMDGGIVFFSAGNDSDSQTQFPSSHDQVIAVAGLNPSDQLAWYSNYGSWVDISAPGGEMRRATDTNGILSTIPNNQYDYDHGTSMACPVVSGVAALLVSQNYGYITPEQVRHIITSTADNVDSGNPNYIGKLGSGRVNAYEALSALNSTVKLTAFVEEEFENQDEIEIIISPNPAKDRISIITQKQSGLLKISNLSGVLLKQEPIQNKMTTLDISFLNSGIYLLSFESGTERTVKKIVKY